MRKIASLILAGAFVVAACGSSTTTGPTAPTGASGGNGSAAPAGQTTAPGGGAGACGTGTYNGFKTTTNCGPAKGTVTIAGTAYQVTGGRCLYDASIGFAVDIGTTVTGTADVAADGPQSLVVLASPSAGASAYGVVHGVSFAIIDGAGADTVVVAADHKSGTASGTAILTDDAITVTFTC